MPTIQIDDEVFGLLQKSARPFVDTPNSALRRMLGLSVKAPVTNVPPAPDELDQLLQQALAESRERRTKAPKANLKVLIRAGLLHEGERLYLVDYQGKKVTPYEAVVSGALLEFEGGHYTMSNLAQELLKKIGFKSDSVRGPSHWVTAKSVSVTELWQQLMEKQKN